MDEGAFAHLASNAPSVAARFGTPFPPRAMVERFPGGHTRVEIGPVVVGDLRALPPHAAVEPMSPLVPAPPPSHPAAKGSIMWRSHRNHPRWLVPCRSIARKRRVLIVAPTQDGRIALITPAGEVAVLAVLEVGRLRGALRDAVHALDDPRTATYRRYYISISRAAS